MAKNWVEDVVAQLYKLKGYMVVENEDLQMPTTDSRKVRGHSDIDVMAIGNNELIHIECQSWWGPSKSKERKDFQRLKDRFELSPKIIFNKYSFLKQEVLQLKRIFITSGKPKKSRGNGPWDRLSLFCSENHIELLEINDVIRDLIDTLKIKYPRKEIVGKEEGITRFLLHLINKGLID